MSSTTKFTIKAMSKSEIAASYNVTTAVLRKWLINSPGTWKKLQYDDGIILKPFQVELIVKLLGEPEKTIDL